MSFIKFNSKKSFVEALEAVREFWTEYDRKREREYQDALEDWAQEARITLREIASLSTPELAAAVGHGFRSSSFVQLSDKPSCPDLMVAKLDATLKTLDLTQSARFTVQARQGSWTLAHKLLTWNPDEKATACG